MKKKIVVIAALLSIAGYLLPFAVTKAGSGPTTPGDVPGAPTTLNVRITAYASVADETDSTPFITANGTVVHNGIIAANFLPFGTEVMIPSLFGNKVFTVEDRMAPYFKNSVDIWMPSVGKAIVFGVHRAEIVVIPPGPSVAQTAGTSTQTTALAVAVK